MKNDQFYIVSSVYQSIPVIWQCLAVYQPKIRFIYNQFCHTERQISPNNLIIRHPTDQNFSIYQTKCHLLFEMLRITNNMFLKFPGIRIRLNQYKIRQGLNVAWLTQRKNIMKVSFLFKYLVNVYKLSMSRRKHVHNNVNKCIHWLVLLVVETMIWHVFRLSLMVFIKVSHNSSWGTMSVLFPLLYFIKRQINQVSTYFT